MKNLEQTHAADCEIKLSIEETLLQATRQNCSLTKTCRRLRDRIVHEQNLAASYKTELSANKTLLQTTRRNYLLTKMCCRLQETFLSK